MLESKGLLDAHVKTHVPKFVCDTCAEELPSKVDLDEHIVDQHKRRVRNEEWNCNDCPFQATISSHLMKHLQLTGHQPNPEIEDRKSLFLDYKQCFNCKMEFEGFWNLMNHRKNMHPSNKRCRNFPNNCTFVLDCWYVHQETDKVGEPNDVIIEEKLSCNSCGMEFTAKAGLMKHKKESHPTTVQLCSGFTSGNCSRGEDQCWYKHLNDRSESVRPEEQVFCEARENIFPPDQMGKMMEMVVMLCQKMEKVEVKISEIIKQ